MSALQLHPENPHYFLFEGKPTVLVTSGEHYGAVLNRAFDYHRYLGALAQDGLNLTRLFTGVHVEQQEAFHIARNTLCPEAGQLLCPWRRSETPGYAHGGNRFDLQAWDEAYFTRLKDFLRAAAAQHVVVEVCLFSVFYEEKQWQFSPWHPNNNVNGAGHHALNEIYTLDQSGELLAVQEAMVRKFVAELNEFDNLYFEIINEPYWGGVTAEWQAHIAELIVAEEAALPKRHLISQNIGNGAEEVKEPHPAVSILNFHYATPPEAVTLNYGLGRVIGDNETGFKGTGDTPYRMEAWEFLLAGGGLYNNLDYSFVVGEEDGTFVYPETQPGGGTAALRRQLGALKQFLEGFDFLAMGPHQEALCGELPEGQRARVLAEPGRQYAGYVFGGTQVTLSLDLPAGKYEGEWLDPVTGARGAAVSMEHGGGVATLTSPEYAEDIALRLVRR